MPSTFTYIAPKPIHVLMKSLTRNESYNENEHARMRILYGLQKTSKDI